MVRDATHDRLILSMPANLPSFVLGYHGCDRAVAEDVLSGSHRLKWSENDYDWLGNGVYFWEHDPDRAKEWVEAKARRRPYEISEPYVIGAVIDLKKCLNLFEARATDFLTEVYTLLQLQNVSLPENLPANLGDKENLLRKRDCMVVEYAHSIQMSKSMGFDSVRGLFPEGEPVFPGAGVRKRTHIQICVRNYTCILGYFRPLDLETGLAIQL